MRVMHNRLFSTCSSLSLALALTASACTGSEPLVPGAGEVTPLAFTMTLSHTNQFGSVEFPAELLGHLHLTVDDAGAVSGALSGYWQPTGRTYTLTGALSAVTGLVVDDHIELDAGEMSAWPEGRIEWDTLSITLGDDDGDGAADSATGSVAGRWTMVTGDVVNSSDVTGEVRAGLDTETPEIRLATPEFPGTTEFLPTDRIRVMFSEPLTQQAVGNGVEITADGNVLTGQIVGTPTAGLLSSIWFEPSEFLPFASDIAVQAVDLTDPSGNPGSAVPDPIPTSADPGALNAVPDLEGDFTGWIQQGTVEAVGEYAGIVPTTGAMQVRMSENSQLLGYMDVSNPVSPFDLSFALFTEYGEIFDNFSAVATVYTSPQDSEELFDAFDHTEVNVECMDCDDFRYQLGPITSRVDLSPYVGQRVFVKIEVNSLFFIGYERHALLVDNSPLVAP